MALLLGEPYHPGGIALTRRLAAALDLRPGQRVIDVASGPGATARLLATEYAVTVDGAIADAVVCECAFYTFPGKQAAAAEFARVLRPGGGQASPTSP